MAIGFDNSTSNKLYCDSAIQEFMQMPTGRLSGITCTSVYAEGTVTGLRINGQTVAMASGSQIDLIISHVGGTLTNACFTCSCHDCYEDETQTMREKTWPFYGEGGGVPDVSPTLPSQPGIYSGYTFYPNTLGGSSLGGPGQFS